MGKNKNGYYNYKVIVYNNRDRTDIKEEKLFKERHEVVDEYGLSISSITKMCKMTDNYIAKYIYIAVEKVQVPISVEKAPVENPHYKKMMAMETDEERFKYMAEKIQENLIQSL